MTGHEPPAARRPDSERDGVTFLALAGLVVAGFGLLGLVALVMPAVLGILAVVGLLFVPAFFHYFLWGRWLSRNQDDANEANPVDDRAP